MTDGERAAVKDWLYILGVVASFVMFVGGLMAMNATRPVLAAQESLNARLTAIETQGSLPLRRAIDSLTVKQDATLYLVCLDPTKRTDSVCRPYLTWSSR